MDLRAKGFLGLTVPQVGFLRKRVLGVTVSLRSFVGDCCLVCLDMRDSLDETGLEKQEKAYGGTGYPVIV